MKRKRILFLSAIVIALLCCGLTACKEDTPSASGKSCQHAFTPWSVLTKATCHNEGKEKRECTLCYEPQTRVIPKLEHEPTPWMTTVEPTCGTEGEKKILCSLCSDTLNFETIPKLTEHELYNTIADVKATCVSDGTLGQACLCGKEQKYTFTPNLGGHKDENHDLVCDECEDILHKVPVTLQFQGNATATAKDHVLVGEKSGGLITVTMGKNSIYKTSYALYPPLSSQSSNVGGNIVEDTLAFIEKRKLETLTTTYQEYISAATPFGIPTAITLEIADTAHTAVAVVETYVKHGERDFDNAFSQYRLFWGTLGGQVEIPPYYESEIATFDHYADKEGDFLSDSPTLSTTLTELITFFRAYYVQPS